MLHVLPCVWVNKAVLVLGAAAGVALCEYSQALEAEASVAIAAEHLVALRCLRCLLGDVLFRNRHATTWTLLRVFFHPLSEATSMLLIPSSVLLTCHTPMIWLHPTSKARPFLARCAQKLP